MKHWLIIKLGLKGSWSWAKRQMYKGEIVRCKHWSGALKLKIESAENPLLQSCFFRDNKGPANGIKLWESSTHHLCYENFTDYEIVKWDKSEARMEQPIKIVIKNPLLNINTSHKSRIDFIEDAVNEYIERHKLK